VPALRVHRHDNSLLSDVLNEPGKERAVYSAVSKCSAADNHLFRTRGEDTLRAGRRTDAAAYAHTHGSPAAELADQSGVAPAAHGGIQVDDVKQRIVSKALEQAENIFHCQTQPAATD
jgi:hypothetical protein